MMSTRAAFLTALLGLTPICSELSAADLAVVSRPEGAFVIVDGRRLVKDDGSPYVTPAQISPFPTGKFKIVLVKKGRADKALRTQTVKGRGKRVSSKLRKGESEHLQRGMLDVTVEVLALQKQGGRVRSKKGGIVCNAKTYAHWSAAFCERPVCLTCTDGRVIIPGRDNRACSLSYRLDEAVTAGTIEVKFRPTQVYEFSGTLRVTIRNTKSRESVVYQCPLSVYPCTLEYLVREQRQQIESRRDVKYDLGIDQLVGLAFDGEAITGLLDGTEMIAMSCKAAEPKWDEITVGFTQMNAELEEIRVKTGKRE